MRRIYLSFCCCLVFLTTLFSASFSSAKILVLAPHPDDDIITAAGITYQAVVRAEPVKIVFMTNGDILGINRGYLRQGEAVTAEAFLGVMEDNLIFLGYPDGYLKTLYDSYTNSNDEFMTPNGQSATYGNRGLGSSDYHFYRYGSHAAYNRHNMVADLADVISEFKPDHILTTSEFDFHPDHSTTYGLLELAMLSVYANDPSYSPTIHKTIVWWDTSGSWPNPLNPNSYFSEIPDFSRTGLNWSQRESIDVPLVMQSTNYTINSKYLAVATHESQGGTNDFLGSYIHKDEIFWTENLVGNNHPPVPHAGFDQTVKGGAQVQLDGSVSLDTDSDSLTFRWVQTGGVPVQLSNPAVVNPTFNAPADLTDETLTFSLVVSDGMFTSLPDSLSVKITTDIPSGNVAPLAAVTASSESPQSGAIKAVDGYIDGYPGDYTREWATNGEKAGAWIQLTWPVPYTVDRVVLYDRPNLTDRILGATLTFSDGSTLQVGRLDNAGRGTEYTFPSKVVTSVRMSVEAVSSGTQNVGLSEFEVYGVFSTGTQYTLTTYVSPLESGSISKSPDRASYAEGEQVTLTATGGPGYAFTDWSGDASGTQNPIIITMNGDRTVTAHFTAGNAPPVAANDAYSTNANTTLDQAAPGVLGNDTDPEGAALTAQLVTGPSHGALTLNAEGSFAYTPAADYAGSDSFTYRASDGTNSSNIATVTLTVSETLTLNSLSLNPTSAVGGNTSEGTATLSGPAPSGGAVVTLSSDNAAASVPAGVTVPGGSTSAAFTITTTAVFSSTPVTVTAVYGGVTKTATLTVTTAAATLNVAPLAAVTASSESPQSGAIKAVDGYIDGYPGDYTREWATNGEKAGAWIQLTWPVPYTVDRVVLYDRPNLTDRILGATLTFSDGSTLQVGRLDNAGRGTEYTFPSKVVTSVRMSVEAVSSGTQNVGLSEFEVYGVFSTGTQYTLTTYVSPLESGSISKSPDRASYAEGEQVTLTATGGPGYAFTDWSGDASGTQNPIIITMNGDRTVTAHFTAANTAPVAAHDAYSTNANTPLDQAAPGVLGNDTDPEGAALTAQLVTGPSHGALTLNAEGSFAYIPAADYAGSDSFTYRASDGTNSSNIATVTLTVSETLTLNSLSLNPTSAVGGNTSQGTATLSGPAPSEGAVVTLSSDNAAASVPAGVTVPGGSTSAAFTITTTTVSGSTPVTVTAVYGGVTKTATLTVTTAIATLNIASLAAVTASSESPQNGQLAVKAVDGYIDGYPGDYTREWATNREKVGAWIQLTWPVPYTVDRLVLYDRPNSTDQILGATLLFSDGSTLQIGPLDNAGRATEYTFPAKVVTSVRMSVDAVSSRTQNIGLSEFEVYGVFSIGNAPPVAANDANSTNANTTLDQPAPGVLGNDTDPEGSALTAQPVSGPSHGTLTLNADGSFTYTPAADYAGSDSFTYRAGDGTNSSNIATVTLTISNPVPLLDHIVISPSSVSITAGESQAFTTEAFDRYNNSLGDVTGMTTFTISPDGSCTGASCTASAAGAHTVTGSYDGKTVQASLQVNPAALSNFLIKAIGGGDIAPQTAGVPFDIRITARDQYNNTVTSFTGTVQIDSNGALNGAPVISGAFEAGELATQSVTINSAQLGTTLSATGPGGANGTSNSFTVNPAGLGNFLVEAATGGNIGPQTAGVPFSIKITARDQYNNTVTSFNGTAALETTAGAISPASVTFLSGASTLSVAVTEAGALQNITAISDTHQGTSNEFTVSPAGLGNFLITNVAGGSIDPQTAGVPFDIKITARDQYNNVIQDFSGTVALSTNADSITPASVTFTGSEGGVLTPSVTLSQSGTDKTITAISDSHIGQSNTFTVNAGVLTHFKVEAAGGGDIGAQTAGATFGIRITAQDANNNTAVSFNETVDISSTGSLSAGSGTTAAFTNGMLTSHSLAILNAGSFTITAAKTGGTEAGESNSFTVNNPIPTLTDILPASKTYGEADFTLTVNGSGFAADSVVQWNGESRTTTYVSSSQLTAAIPAADIAAAGTAQVTVFSPAPGGGTSNAQTFIIE